MNDIDNIPTNDWGTESDDFSSTPVNETQSNDWDNWGTSQPSNTSDDWDSWDTPLDSTNNNQSDGWDDFQSSNTEEQDMWGSSVNNESDGHFIDNSDLEDDTSWDDWDNQSNNQNADNDYMQNNSNIQENIPRAVNLSTKKAGFVVAGVILIVAFLLFGLDKIHISSKPKAQTQNQTVQNQDNTSQPAKTTPSVTAQTNSVVLVEIPESTTINYATDIFTANGTVVSKTKYVQGNQVLYCVIVQLNFGSSVENVNYYCNYSSYNQVSVGDIVVINYQQVEDSYISVNSISK